MLNDRVALAKYFNELGFKRGAEVGVADGRYSEILCQSIPGLVLFCVDPWNTYKDNRRGGGKDQQFGNYETAKKRLEKFDATLIRSFSVPAAQKFPDECLDFVFIDANHDFDYVMEDIITWSRKVRKGGIISGHDYYQFHNSGIIEAVNSYVNYHHLDLNLTLRNDGYKDDRCPCFWWVKV